MQNKKNILLISFSKLGFYSFYRAFCIALLHEIINLVTRTAQRDENKSYA